MLSLLLWTYSLVLVCCIFFFCSSRRRHTSCALVTGVQTCVLPICIVGHAFIAEFAFDPARAALAARIDRDHRARGGEGRDQRHHRIARHEGSVEEDRKSTRLNSSH